MKAVILAAGEGTRLRPLTESMSKGMLPVGNRPILSYGIEALERVGVRDIVMVVGYRREKVQNYFGDGSRFGVRIEYVHQKSRIGTAHALFQARDKVDGPFLVVPGDNLFTAKGLKGLLELPPGSWGLLITESRMPSKYGVVEVKGGKLLGIREKPKLSSDLRETGMPSVFSLALWEYTGSTDVLPINTGIYLFNPEIFEVLERMGVEEKHRLTEAIEKMVREGYEFHCIFTDSWRDAVYPWDLLELNEIVLKGIGEGISGDLSQGAIVKGRVFTEGEVRIGENAVIEGPVILGEGVEIGPFSYVGPYTSVGAGTRIGAYSRVARSILMEDVLVEERATVLNSVVASGTILGSGVFTDASEFEVKLRGITMKKRIGAIIGEDCSIGHQSVIASGAIVGNRCNIAPLKHVNENLPDGSRVL
ncbi:MAG: NTP transferase domain-containing protein [Thermoplasmata archaeon]|nr:NTP transferase domain-containing protein [Thermoplasmata archaeon]